MNLTSLPDAFQFVNFTTSAPVAAFPWTPGRRHSPKTGSWPPRGLHLAVNLEPPQLPPGPFNFSFLPGVEWSCAGEGLCLTGWPTCNYTAVPGQCSWPAETAVEECSRWPACQGVNCNSIRTDCQARDDPSLLSAGLGYSSYVRSSESLYRLGDTAATLHYEIYDGLPVLRK